MAKIRIDKLLLKKKLVHSRETAIKLIKEDKVLADNVIVGKPSTLTDENANIRIIEYPEFVSRGGEKLKGALEDFDFNVKGLICIDIGASTGGFTDCLLKRGAKFVTCVDVGKNQLSEKLKLLPQIEEKEKYNFRYASHEDFNKKYDLAVIDVSFISLCLIIPKLKEVLASRADVIALIKPQFEVVRKFLRKGVVKDASGHQAAIEKVTECFLENGFEIIQNTQSKLKGPKGNIEFFIWAKNNKT